MANRWNRKCKRSDPMMFASRDSKKELDKNSDCVLI